MCQIRRKVSARTGAALLLALFYFLLCCVVGGITVTAASTNAVRISRAKLDQQTYLAVRSAARAPMFTKKYPAATPIGMVLPWLLLIEHQSLFPLR